MPLQTLNKKVNNVTLNIGFGKPKSVNFLSKLIEVKTFLSKDQESHLLLMLILKS